MRYKAEGMVTSIEQCPVDDAICYEMELDYGLTFFTGDKPFPYPVGCKVEIVYDHNTYDVLSSKLL